MMVPSMPEATGPWVGDMCVSFASSADSYSSGHIIHVLYTSYPEVFLGQGHKKPASTACFRDLTQASRKLPHRFQ